MRQSSTYQAILKEGRDEGRIEEARHFLLFLGEERFGKPSVRVRRAIDAITDKVQLEQMGRRVLSASTWDELLAS